VSETARFDESGHFVGHEPRGCGEHRTVGEHRAWCGEDSAWCYPRDPCDGCRAPLPTYREVHRWLVDWRGDPSTQTCAFCDSPAREWSFDNRSPHWFSDEGLAYYPDPRRYLPLCHQCHADRDSAESETCKNGHRWADGNRYRRKDGHGTICRACRREWMAQQRRERGVPERKPNVRRVR